MLDTHRRRELMRIVTENHIDPTEADFIKDTAHFIHTGIKPECRPQFGESLAYAEKMLCAVNKKIPAIKSVRERTNMGLKEAKDLVDDWCQTPEYYDMKALHGGH